MPSSVERAQIAAHSIGAFARAVLRHGVPRRVLSFTGGIGDDLLCTAVLREWRKRGARGVWMFSRYRELFEHNRDLDAVLPGNNQIARLAQAVGAQVIEPRYAIYNPAEDRDIIAPGHLITAMCAQAGIRGEVALRPYIHLTEAERNQGRIGQRQIAVQSSGMMARYPMRNKEWFPERMQSVVDALRGQHTVVQIGAASDPPLGGVVDLRGKTTLRETAAVLAHSALFVGLAGFPMHLARAVECRSVIVYGGREDPARSGYSCNENLYNPVPCAPCWKKNDCPFERRCMDEITPDMVLAGVERAMTRQGEPLAVDFEHIGGQGSAIREQVTRGQGDKGTRGQGDKEKRRRGERESSLQPPASQSSTTANRRPSVTFCAYDGRGELNGPNVWLTRVLPSLQARGVDVRVLFLLSAPPAQCLTYQALLTVGVPCKAVQRQRSTGERVRWLIHELRANPPNVFVPNVVIPAYYAARYARAAGVATVGILHSDDEFHHALIERFVAGRAEDRLSALVCVSKALEDLARKPSGQGSGVGGQEWQGEGETRRRGEGKENKETRRQGDKETRRRLPATSSFTHHPSSFAYNRQQTDIIRIPYGVPIPRQTAMPPGKTFRLVYIGRLDEEQKRISDVARAMCRASRALPGVEGVIYGAGHGRDAVESILASEGAGLPVWLGGELAPNAVQTAMLESHALVLLSAYEGLPIALMEAMACGLVPICAPMRSGIGELVRHGENGLVAANSEALVEAVRRLRQEPGLWSRLSVAAHTTITGGYDEASCADQWAALLHELSADRSSGMIELPRRLVLPPAHRAFRREDHRGPPALADALRRGRYVLGELRQRVRPK